MSATLACLAMLLAACGGDDGPGPGDAATDAAAPADAPVAHDALDGDGGARATRRVLFIGNSYTAYNDLPGLVRDLATAAPDGPALEIGSTLVGGATLRVHHDGDAPARIAEGWDDVVLQGQSAEPLTMGAMFDEFADRLVTLVRDAGARPLFYATWARAAGNEVYAEAWSGGSPAAMQDGLTAAYCAAGARNGVEIAHAGEAFRAALAEAPPLAIHDADGSHPSPLGSYLAACVLYEALTGRPAPDAAPSSVDPDMAARARAIASVRFTCPAS